MRKKSDSSLMFCYAMLLIPSRWIWAAFTPISLYFVACIILDIYLQSWWTMGIMFLLWFVFIGLRVISVNKKDFFFAYVNQTATVYFLSVYPIFYRKFSKRSYVRLMSACYSSDVFEVLVEANKGKVLADYFIKLPISSQSLFLVNDYDFSLFEDKNIITFYSAKGKLYKDLPITDLWVRNGYVFVKSNGADITN